MDNMIVRRAMVKEHPRAARVLFWIGVVLSLVAAGAGAVVLLNLGVWPFMVFFFEAWWLFHFIGWSVVDWNVLFGPDPSRPSVVVNVSPTTATEPEISEAAWNELAWKLRG